MSHSHARAKVDLVRRSDRWELAGIAEPDEATAARYKAEGVPILPPERLLGDAGVQVIAVESAVKDHAAHARLVLEAGKHLHLEKPPAESLGELRGLLDLAAARKRLVQVGYMWRHHPGINAVLEAARQGWLGEVYLVRACINTSIPAAGRRELARFRGGQMFELGCHLIDPIVRLLGRPERVTPVLRHHGRFDDALADNTVAVLEYPKALAAVSSASMQPGAFAHRSFEAAGTNGTAVVRPLEPPELAIDLAQAAGPYRQGSQKAPLPEYRRYVAEFAALAEAVATGRPLGVDSETERLVHETLLRASDMPV